MFLVFYRQLDKPNGRHEGPINTSIGVEWGIFVAFLLGALLAYAGFRIRQAHTPEPVADDAHRPRARRAPRREPAPVARRGRRRADPTTHAPRTERRPSPDRPRPRRTTRRGTPAVDGDLEVDEPAEYRPPPRKR